MGGFYGFNHIFGIATGADGQQDIAFVTKGFQVSGENKIVTIVVADTSHVTGIRDGDSWNSRTVISVSSGEFFCKVHSIAETTTIATAKDFATIADGLYH